MADESPAPAPVDPAEWRRLGEEHDLILRQVVARSPFAVVITDTHGTIEYVNARFCEMTGFSAKEVVGTNASTLKSGEMSQEFFAGMWERLNQGIDWCGEFLNRKKSGELFWESATIAAIRDSGGSIRHFVKIADDISAQKRTREELQASMETLKTRESALNASYDQLTALTRALEQSEQNTRDMANRDALTGLLNRRGFDVELRRAWALAERNKSCLGVLVIDVDHFKMVNDVNGHSAGDDVLRECAALLGKALRVSDIVGRYGGDELVVVLPLIHPEEASAAAERILNVVREHVFSRGRKDLKITVSIGVACGEAKAGIGPESLLIRADNALYKAKEAGRNRMRISDGNSASHGSAETQRKENGSEGPSRGVRGLALVVDDEAAIGSAIGRILGREGYETVFHSTIAAAREYAAGTKGSVDVAFLDLTMEDDKGFALLQELIAMDDATVCVMITGAATTENAIKSLRYGAFDFIAKPIEGRLLASTMDRALRHRRLLIENRSYRLRLEDLVHEKSQALMRALDQMRSSYRFTLDALVAMLGAREVSAGEHGRRVSETARIIAEGMELKEDDVETVVQGALLHDIGKISVPDAVLIKQEGLTKSELEIVRRHSEIGYSILHANPDMEKIAEIVRSQHESFDGSGYPRGLRGEDICLGARIFAAVDVYDVMRSAPGSNAGAALAGVRALSGKRLDPKIVKIVEIQQQAMELKVWTPVAAGGAQ